MSQPIFTYLRQPLKRYTFQAPQIKKWVEHQCKGKVVLNLFAGPTRLEGCREVTNDLDRNFKTDYHLDALELLKQVYAEDYGVVLLDPPYSYRKSMEMYNGNLNSRFKQCLDLIPRVLAPDGLVITFGYHSRVMSASRGFRVKEICLISHGGAQHDTIASVEERSIKVSERKESDSK